jgi:hypothetical protein
VEFSQRINLLVSKKKMTNGSAKLAQAATTLMIMLVNASNAHQLGISAWIVIMMDALNVSQDILQIHMVNVLP